jgi:hypothetical protein
MREARANFWGWLVLIGVVAVMGWPLLRLVGPVLLRIAAPLLLLFGGIWLAAKAGLFHRWVGDEWTEDEVGSRRRLADLQHRSDQVRLTIRELRALRLTTEEAVRAEWAEVDLDEALASLQRAMARERALLFSIEAARWVEQVEPLLAGPDVPAAEAGPCRPRRRALRSQGMDLRARLRSDRDILALDLGNSTAALVDEMLARMDRRADRALPGRW